eukprot:11198899-Lingulodinium_polyedra.AAC.1
MASSGMGVETCSPVEAGKTTTGGCGMRLSLAALMVWKFDTGNRRCPEGRCSNSNFWEPGGRVNSKSPGP